MSKKPKFEPPAQRARRIIKRSGGMIRTSHALREKIHPRTLYMLRDKGELQKVSRGLYRLADYKPFTDPDIVIVASRIPKAVISLISALAYHELTTQIPHEVSIAVEKGAKYPKLDYPPISVYHFSSKSFVAGIETHKLEGILVRVYCPEKTLADCFKFRNKIGMDIVLEALKLYKTRRKFNLSLLLDYARICRVEKIIKPYLETII